MIDSTILELSRSKREFARMSETIQGEPGALLFVTFFGDTPAEAGAQLDRLDGRLARARPRLPHAARRDGRRAGRADQGPQGRASAC